MKQINHIGSLLARRSIVASAGSQRLGAPLLFVFVVLGMLAGEDGPGGIPFNDFYTAQLVGSVALAIIIFDGGLRTRKEVFGVALWPAVSLATVGVVATAAVVGAFATWLLGLHWLQGMLLGAIIGSTDAAAVFGLLRNAGAELKRRVGGTLEIESASNDPMAIFLTIALVGVLARGGTGLEAGILVEFVKQFGIGALIGWFGGRWLGALINRLTLVTALYPLLAAHDLPIEDNRRDLTLAEYLHRAFHGRAVVGDRLRLGPAELVVRRIAGGRIARVGLKLHH
jgi:cell volume regulation protein A